MEFTGDEKKIQALFSELSLEQHTPGFEKLWRAAETSAPAPVVKRFALALTTAAIVVAACSIATWSWYRSSQAENAANIPPQMIPTTTKSRPEQQQFLSADSREPRILRPRRLRPRQTERVALRQAAVLSNWESPTNILLNSPTASFLSSLPQLNQSARDLEQFLPKNNDVMKESKQ